MLKYRAEQDDVTIPEERGHPLSALTESLNRVVRESEDEFLSLGMNLQQVQAQSSAQRKKIAACMSIFGDDGGILPQISSYVKNSQQETQKAQQGADTLCADLARITQLMDQVARKTHALERSGMLLNVIGINTGIECARHTAMEAMFKVVSHDTISLAEQIRSSTESLLEQTVKARNDQDQTLSEARRDIDQLKSLSQESNQTTEAAMTKVAELVDYTISMVNEAEQMAKNISAEISRVVMGIQFHDNLRQRVEHVNEALLETPESSPDQETRDCDTYLAVELQQAQLEKLVEELDGLYRTQTQALTNIANEVEHLEQRLGEMSHDPLAGKNADNPVTILLKGIAALEHINADSHELGDKIGASAGHAEQIVRDMQTAIRSTFAIAGSVKINALNAIIKAAKFGRNGEALEVLAQGMVAVSRDARKQVEVFNELLQELGELAHTEEANRAEMTQTGPDRAFDGSQIETVFLRFRDELHTLCADCRDLGRSLSVEVNRLDFIRRLKEVVSDHAAQLESYAQMIRPEDEELLEQARFDFGELLAARYTMDEERHIHRQTLSQTAELPSSADNTAAGECLFFDTEADEPRIEPKSEATPTIELFDATDTAVPEAEETEIFSDDVVLFDTTTEPTEVSEGDVRSEPHIEPEIISVPPEAEIELWGTPADKVEETSSLSLPEESAAEECDTTEDDARETDKEDFGENVELF